MCGLLAAASCMTACNRQATQAENDGKLTLVVGSYASAADEGIRTFTFDQITGECTALCGLRGISNPSFLTVTDDGKRVYAVGENNAEEATANLILLDRQTGSLTLADTKHVHGADPCHLAVSPDSTRQECAHLHYVYFSPEGKWLMADDLGSDCIRMFPLAPQTALGIDTTAAREVKLVAGSGPRHAVFDHKGQHLYVINELKGDVVVWEYADGALKQTQSIQADSVGARGSADIHMSPDGQFLYASNRLQADGIAIFRVDAASGQLTHTGYQNTAAHPRNFAITPNGKFLLVACRDADCIEIYERDTDTGLLTDTGKRIEMPRPVVVQMVKQ